MRAQNELLDAIQVLIDKSLKDKATKVTGGKVKSASGGRAIITINGYDYPIPYSGDAPKVGSTVRVFIPDGNMSDAFIGGGGGGGSTGTTNYNNLTNKPSINGTMLSGNKTSTELGVYGTGNEPPYPVTSVNGQTGAVTINTDGKVTSVNGQTGDVVLNAESVGALPSTTKIPSATSDLTNDSGFITAAGAPVQSVDGQTGEVVTNAVKTTAQTLTDVQKAQARTNIGAGTSSFSGAYDDLTGKPTIPSKTSELNNDSGFITNAALTPYKYEANLNWGGKFISGNASPVDAAIISTIGGNKAQFCKPEGIIVEYTNDGGNTWVTYPCTNDDKVKLLSDIGVRFYVGHKGTGLTVDDKLRITINAGNCGLYTVLKKILIYSTGGNNPVSNNHVLLERRVNTSGSDFEEVGNYSGVAGYPSWNSLPFEATFGNRYVTNCSDIRLTFSQTAIAGPYASVSIDNILLIGITNYEVQSNMARTGHLYSYDIQQNAIFPAKLTATSFDGDGSALTNIPYPVTSVNTKTGAVVLTQDEVGNGTTYVRTHNDFTDAAKQQINTNEDNIAMLDSDMEAAQGDITTLKGNMTTLTTALQSKQDKIVGGASTITDDNLTANRALVSDGNGKVAVSNVTNTELGYLDGVTSNVQTQLDKKLESAPVTSVNTKTGAVVLGASDVGAVATSDVTQTLGTSTTKVPSEKAVADALSSAGAGDMLKATYDPTGSVEQAGGIPDYVAGQLPTVNDATLTIQKNGTDVGTFTANASANKSINITMAKGDVGLSNVDNVKQYSADNPPPYPVTSVAGKTGDVTLTKADVGLGNVDNVKQYSASNPPPYPVTSVNGQTGAVTIDAGGGTTIVLSSSQPSGLKAGDYWYQIVT